MKKNILILAIALLTIHCSSGMHKPTSNAPENAIRVDQKGLTQQEALKRASQIKDIRYDLSFSLPETDSEFAGQVQVDFSLRTAGQPLTVDFNDGHVLSVEINGYKEPAFKYNGMFLTLPPDKFTLGRNSVRIAFSHPYSHSGAGLHQFKDPEDGKFYLYTHFEPYEANRLFPCFDQPDLKATYRIKAEVPSSWKVISSVREESVTPMKDHKALWTFPESALFSTYLISLHAGEYKVWQSQAGSVPLRLFARQSLAKYVTTKDWFLFAQQGLKFYGNYFDLPYPFVKFDMVVVPDFNMGAMENVAAITFSERYIKRGKLTEDDREGIAEVLLHEMAHQWFGDLVTMKWWNGLWLNESFATYMSYMALNGATEFKKSWMGFFLDEKQGAYSTDELVTTHPIDVPMADTEHAFANFDEITYGKGASALKQLAYYLGEGRFRDGVKAYFKKYGFKNAETKDFIASLESAAKLNLKDWAKEWLETAGLNTLEVRFECKDSKVASFKLAQMASPQWPTLRTHRTEVALFTQGPEGPVAFEKSVPMTYTESADISELRGSACPALVYPNFGDHDYVKVKLDAQTVMAVQKNLSLIKDPFARAMFWASMWQMVRDGDLSVVNYARLVFENIGNEKEYKIVDTVLYTVYGWRPSSPSVLLYLPQESSEAGEFRKSYIAKMEDFFWSHVMKSDPGSDFQKRWFDAFVRIAQTPQGQDKLARILRGEIKLPGFPIDQDRRWNLVWQLNAVGSSWGKTALAQEKRRDPSNAGINMAIAAEAVVPDLNVKKEWFQKMLDHHSNIPLAQLRSAMRSLFPPDQSDLKQRFVDPYFQSLPDVAANKDDEFQTYFTELLAPSLCNQASVDKFETFLSTHKDLSPIITKELRIAQQEDQRCFSVRNVALKNWRAVSSNR